MAQGTLKAHAQTDGTVMETWSQTSASGQAATTSTGTVGSRKLTMVTCKYSGAASVTVTVTLNAGAGAAYDTLLQNIVFTAATDGVYIPIESLPMQDGDAIDVVAPALAAGTSAVQIYTEAT